MMFAGRTTSKQRRVAVTQLGEPVEELDVPAPLQVPDVPPVRR